MLMLARKFANYRLHMAGITQNRQKCLFSLWSLKARKTIFSFSKCFEKMVFPKKSHWNIIFLVSLRNMIFLFLENMILFFRRKMKDDLPQKNTWKYDIFFKCSKRLSFQKSRTGIWSFFCHQERWHFFFPKIWYFLYGWKMKDDLSQKIHGNMMFSVCSVCYTFVKKAKMIFSRKMDLKMAFPALLKMMIFILEKMILAF